MLKLAELSLAALPVFMGNANAEMLICDTAHPKASWHVDEYRILCSNGKDAAHVTTPFKLVEEGWKIEHFAGSAHNGGYPAYQFVFARASKQ